MLAGQNLVTCLGDQLVLLIVKPLAGMVRLSSGFFQCRVGRDHLSRDEILADAEVL